MKAGAGQRDDSKVNLVCLSSRESLEVRAGVVCLGSTRSVGDRAFVANLSAAERTFSEDPHVVCDRLSST